MPLLTNAAKALVRNFAPRLAFQISIRNDFWNEIELKLLDIIVDPQRSAIDVGANTGRYALPLCNIATHVFAIEPNLHVAQLLIAGLPSDKVTVLQRAVSDRLGVADLVLPTDRWGNGGENLASLERRYEGHTKTIKVPMMLLDDLKDQQCGFIKIDIEGHEYAAIKGATEILNKHKPVILMECDDPNASSCELLKSFGYEGFFVHDRRFHFLGDYLPSMGVDSKDQAHLPRRKRAFVSNFLFFPAGDMGPSLFDRIQDRLSGL